MSQLNTKRDPSYVAGGKGSEVTRVFDGGAGSQGMIKGQEQVKSGNDCPLNSRQDSNKMHTLYLCPLLTDCIQLDAVAESRASCCCHSAVVRTLYCLSDFQREHYWLVPFVVSVCVVQDVAVPHQVIDDRGRGIWSNTAESHV